MLLKRTLVLASGLACALTIAIWLSTFLASYTRSFYWDQNPLNHLDVSTWGEGIVLAYNSDDPLPPIPAHAGGSQPYLYFMGVGYFNLPNCSVIFFPFWLLIAATIIAPARAVWREGRRNCVGTSLCLKCHYDLRMHRPGDRCPECGLLIGESTLPSFPVQLDPAI